MGRDAQSEPRPVRGPRPCGGGADTTGHTDLPVCPRPLKPCIYIFCAVLLMARFGSSLADSFLTDSEINRAVIQYGLRDCALKHKCPGEIAIQGDDFQLTPVDLNDDGIDEISLKTKNLAYCGSAGCETVIIQLTDNRWHNIFDGYNISLLSKTTNGYHDILIGYRGKQLSNYAGGIIYCWNGRNYAQCYKANMK